MSIEIKACLFNFFSFNFTPVHKNSYGPSYLLFLRVLDGQSCWQFLEIQELLLEGSRCWLWLLSVGSVRIALVLYHKLCSWLSYALFYGSDIEVPNEFIWFIYQYCSHIYPPPLHVSAHGHSFLNNEFDNTKWASFISDLHAKLRILSRGVTGFATDSPWGVWCRGWTTCLFFKNNSRCVILA